MFKARPLASTSTTEIWTEAWSFEVMRRSVDVKSGRYGLIAGSAGRTGSRALAGDVKVDENALKRQKRK